MTRHISFMLVLLLAACGGAPEETESEVPEGESATAGDESEPEPEAEPIEYAANPLLNMYVQGPDPDPGESYGGATPDDYHASIVVTNTGDASIAVQFAHIHFEVWTDEGEMVGCDNPQPPFEALPGPAELGPGDAHTYRAQFHCELEESGRYMIRAYMAFGAEAPTFERERHYVGGYPIRVP